MAGLQRVFMRNMNEAKGRGETDHALRPQPRPQHRSIPPSTVKLRATDREKRAQ